MTPSAECRKIALKTLTEETESISAGVGLPRAHLGHNVTVPCTEPWSFRLGWFRFSEILQLPIHYRAIVGIVLGLVFARLTHFIHEFVFIDGDAQAGPGWDGTVTVHYGWQRLRE